MGALCSKNIDLEKESELNGSYDAVWGKHGSRVALIRLNNSVVTPSHESAEKSQSVQNKQNQGQAGHNMVSRQGSRTDFHDFYDGIPRVPVGLSQKSRSLKSTQATVNKVSEMSSLLGRAGTMGFEKAVEVLDVLGSSMTDLNAGSGFVSGSSRGTKISILAFEVANTIVMSSRILHSLTEEAMKYLKVVLASEGVQRLISKDTVELLKIVSLDKRQELAMFSAEVVRFGNRCKDPQWHNLDRFFLKQSGDSLPVKQLMENAEVVISQLMALVHSTLELYHELHSLDRFEQDYHFKRGGEGDRSLRGELKKERKLVKSLKKRSLWSRSLEEVIEKLVDVVISVDLKIHASLNADGKHKDEDGHLTTPGQQHQRLGPAGLALHYANIVLQIDGIVARSSLTLNARESLYQNLPPSIKSTLRSKLQLLEVKEELGVSDIKAEMEKTLQWLVPMASNTVKSHHGFGWVGEWANTGVEPSRSSTSQIELFRIDTLYHADKDKTESLITEQLLWLHHLIQKQREAETQITTVSLPSLRTSTYVLPPLGKNRSSKLKENVHTSSPEPLLTAEDKEILKEAIKGNKCERKSKSEEFDVGENLNMHERYRMIRSNGQSPTRQSDDLPNVDHSLHSGLCKVGFGLEKHRSLDSFDTVQVAG